MEERSETYRLIVMLVFTIAILFIPVKNLISNFLRFAKLKRSPIPDIPEDIPSDIKKLIKRLY